MHFEIPTGTALPITCYPGSVACTCLYDTKIITTAPLQRCRVIESSLPRRSFLEQYSIFCLRLFDTELATLQLTIQYHTRFKSKLARGAWVIGDRCGTRVELNPKIGHIECTPPPHTHSESVSTLWTLTFRVHHLTVGYSHFANDVIEYSTSDEDVCCHVGRGPEVRYSQCCPGVGSSCYPSNCWEIAVEWRWTEQPWVALDGTALGVGVSFTIVQCQLSCLWPLSEKSSANYLWPLSK